MVYCFIISLFLSHANLFCNSHDDYTFSKPSSKKITKPTPKMISEETNNYLYAYGAYLYYLPNTDGLGYAITGVNQTTTNTMLGINKGDYLFPDQHPGSGFKVGLGGQLGYDKMIVETNFSNWQSHNLTKNQGSGDCSSALFNGTYYADNNNIALWNNQINTTQSPDQNPLPLTYSYTDWTQKFFLFNFVIKADKLIGSSFIIRPQIGALYAYTKELYDINYVFDQTAPFAIVNGLYNAKIFSSQKAHSIGPKVGLTSLFYPLDNWALFGQFFCTPALNRFKMQTEECATYNQQTAPNTILDDVLIFNVEHKNYSITPIIELGLGLEANLNLFSTPSKIIIGFDQKYFFSHNYIKPPDFNSLYTPGNYSVMGLNLSASFTPFSNKINEHEALDKTKTFLHPHYRRPKNKIGISLEGEILYPKPAVEGLAYAVNGINLFNFVLNNTDYLDPGKVYNPQFTKEFAFKGAINAHLKYAALDICAECFILPQIQVSSPTTQFKAWSDPLVSNQAQALWFQDFSSFNLQGLFGDIFFGDEILQEASSNYTLYLQKFNLFHSSNFLLKKHLSFQTKFGLTFLKQKQTYDINYNYLDILLTSMSIDVKNKQYLRAIGPSFKINSSFFLANFFAFYGDLELSAPYGRVKIQSNADVTATDNSVNPPVFLGSTNYWSIENKVLQIFPCIIGEGGIKLMIWGKEHSNALSISAGYNSQAFLSNNFMQPIVNANTGWQMGVNNDLSSGGYMNNSKGTLGLSGFIFRVGAKF